MGMMHAEQRGGNRFPDLEVVGAVFDLQNDIVIECTVKRHIGFIGGFRTVCHRIAPVLLTVVDEGAPDDDAAERFDCPGQHIGAVCVGSAVCEGAGTMLTVRFDDKAGQIRNGLPDHGSALFPEILDLSVERVGGGQPMAQRKRKITGQHKADAKGAEEGCERGDIRKKVFHEALCIFHHIDIVDAQGIDPAGGEQTRQCADAVRIVADPSVFKKQGAAGITAFNAAGEVVPAVEHAQRIGRGLDSLRQCLMRKMRKNQLIGSVKQSGHASTQEHPASFLFPDPLFMHVFLKAQFNGNLREICQFGTRNVKRCFQCVGKCGCKLRKPQTI